MVTNIKEVNHVSTEFALHTKNSCYATLFMAMLRTTSGLKHSEVTGSRGQLMGEEEERRHINAESVN